MKLDPSKGVMNNFIALNAQVTERFSSEERQRIGIHTCPGGDQDSPHSADVDDADLLPTLFELDVGNFYIQLASEPDRRRVLDIIKEHPRDSQKIFVGVIDPINPEIEAAEFIPRERLGTTDDCSFSPFGDDMSTARETAFAKIRARVEGTKLAAQKLGV